MEIAMRVVALTLIVAVVVLGRLDHRDLLVPGLLLFVAAWGASTVGNPDLANLFGFIAFSLLVVGLVAALAGLIRGSRRAGGRSAPEAPDPDRGSPPS